MANLHFLRKLAVDELWDTAFFATGSTPVKEKSVNFTIIKADSLTFKVHTNRRIAVNGIECRSVPEAKSIVCKIIS